ADKNFRRHLLRARRTKGHPDRQRRRQTQTDGHSRAPGTGKPAGQEGLSGTVRQGQARLATVRGIRGGTGLEETVGELGGRAETKRIVYSLLKSANHDQRDQTV